MKDKFNIMNKRSAVLKRLSYLDYLDDRGEISLSSFTKCRKKLITELHTLDYVLGKQNGLDSEDWFNQVKLLCDELGYASNMKDYKNNPEAYKGNVADVSTVLRVALTSKSMTPDLCEIMNIMGKDRVINRYNELIEKN